MFWSPKLILSLLVFKLLKTQSFCAPSLCDSYINRAYQTGLRDLVMLLAGYSPVRQYKPNNFIFCSPGQGLYLPKTRPRHQKELVLATYIYFIHRVFTNYGDSVSSEIIDASHSLLDTNRSYGEGAMKVIWFGMTLPLLRIIPQNFESREKRYADILHLFKKYYNLP